MDMVMEKDEGTEGTEVVASGFTDYRKYKAELDGELARAAQSFVRIGFLLRVAEDTDILRESGYRNVTEFAAAEYGLDKSQVSRFININIRFSENGYSDYLQERYERFGYAKLAIMLSLPEAVGEELPDSLSKAEIQAVADEVRAESAISDIEVEIEKAEVAPVQPEGQASTPLYQAAAQLCREQQDLFCRMWYGRDSLECMQDILAPMGEAIYMVRIPGKGRIMVTVREMETSLTTIRTSERERHTTEEFVMEIWQICQKGETPGEAFLREFGEEMEKAVEAPAGQKPRPAAGVGREEPKQRRTSRVTKARTERQEPAAAVQEQESPVGEQLPGQMDVTDYPEMLPEGMREENHGEGKGQEGTHSTEEGTEPCPGGQGDDPQGHDAFPGTPADDGCTEDPGSTGMTEKEVWEEAKQAFYKLRVRFEKYRGIQETMDIGEIQAMYRDSIGLAAALEKIMMIRSKGK